MTRESKEPLWLLGPFGGTDRRSQHLPHRQLSPDTLTGTRIRCLQGRACRLTQRQTQALGYPYRMRPRGCVRKCKYAHGDTHTYVNSLKGMSTHMQMRSQPSPGDKCAHGHAQTMNCCLHICLPHLSPMRYPQFLTPKSLAPTQPSLSFLLISTPDTNPLLRGGDGESPAQLGGVHLPSHGLQPCMQLGGVPVFRPFSPTAVLQPHLTFCRAGGWPIMSDPSFCKPQDPSPHLCPCVC